MSTIEELKKEALSELASEANSETSEVIAEVASKTTEEVIAEIITFENLQAKISEATKAGLQVEASKLLNEGKFDEVQILLNSAKSKVLQLANNLPKYYLLNENGMSYLVPVPAQPIRTVTRSSGSGSTNKYPYPFHYGDRIYLVNKEGTVKSQVYEVTQASLVGNDDHEPIKASKAVENFMINQMGKVLAPDFAGYPGTTFHLWRKLTN